MYVRNVWTLAGRVASVRADDVMEMGAIDAAVARFFNAPVRPYTRSRDALKAIRPPDWYFDINENRHGADARLTRERETKKPHYSIMRIVSGPRLATSELAELYVTILAVATDRADEKAFTTDADLVRWPLGRPKTTRGSGLARPPVVC
jgi:hypothetical protein